MNLKTAGSQVGLDEGFGEEGAAFCPQLLPVRSGLRGALLFIAEL